MIQQYLCMIEDSCTLRGKTKGKYVCVLSFKMIRHSKKLSKTKMVQTTKENVRNPCVLIYTQNTCEALIWQINTCGTV